MSKTDHIYMPADHMDQLYTSGNPLVRFVHVQRLQKIVDELPLQEGLNVLDAGCGEGHLIQRMQVKRPGNQYFGVDIVENALQRCRKRAPFATLERADLDRLPYDDGFFDVVVCTEVLEHVYEYSKVMGELTRTLRPGGLLILTHPNELNWTLSRLVLFRRPIRVPDHVNAFTPGKFRREVGLKSVKRVNLPFRLPFSLSLNCLHKFQK
jgi:2-polyprenyl-3-methyl-5-hydroxy-6-metoxy-1,4-benzoquinol methylase